MNHLPQAPELHTLGSFLIVLKIRGVIHKSMCTTSINDTGGNIAAGTEVTNLPPVSMTLVADLATVPLVFFIPVATCRQYQQHCQ
jgi:hypothetical protein